MGRVATGRKPLRIGIDTLFLDGRERSSLANFVIALVEGIAAAKTPHTVIVFASRSAARFFGNLYGVQVVLCPVGNEHRLTRIAFQQLLLPQQIRRQRVDVLCCLADVAPLATNVPIVLKVNSLHHFTAPRSLGFWRSGYRRFMIRWSADKARYVVANSKPTAHDIEALLAAPPHKIRLIYEAVDESFQPSIEESSDRLIVRDRYGIDRPYILFVSALYRYKNLDQTMRAFARLLETAEWSGELVVVGPDPHGRRRESERIANELGVGNCVRFLGAVDNAELPKLYRAASLFVYPSASETFGKPVVEAMRCGTPIVAANRGSIPDIASGAAILVDPTDAGDIADAMAKLLRDADLRSRLRQIGLERGRQFSWHRVAEEFLEVLESAAG